MRITVAVRRQRYGITDKALIGHVPRRSYDCPKKHHMNRGRSGLLGIGPPHVTACKAGNGIISLSPQFGRNHCAMKPYYSGRFSTVSQFVYRIWHLTGMPLASL